MHKEVAQDLGFNIFRRKSWLLIFALCFVYWGYLIFHTKMMVVFDSIDYENTGRLIYQNGWLDFFRTGPHREPLYPALIALSMALGDFLSTNYQLILKVFQVAFLFLTQILLIVLLRKLKVREGIIKLAVFYFGISPAVINATFSVYCEIVVFPFVVAAILVVSSSWSDIIKKREYKFILGKAILLGACFSLLAFGRDVFQYVFYFFILPFCVFVARAFFRHWTWALRRLLIFIPVVFIIFFTAVTYIKTMNFRYNGKHVLCETHLSIFLGSAYKRSQPISPRIIASHIASIPGTGVCRLFFPQPECDYADWYGSDQFRVTEAVQRMDTIPKDHQEREVFRLVLEKVMEHPIQYIFFSAVEAFKMPFWESTKIGFVGYSDFLTKVYDYPFVKFGLRLFFGLMTIIAFVYVTFDLWREKEKSFSMKDNRQEMVTLLFVWLMIASYTFPYSLCYVLTRYALPIASMYIICISVMVNTMISNKFVNLWDFKEK